MLYQRSLRNTVAGIVLCTLPAFGHAGQDQPNYKFSDAVREISQLYWLAETANTCGWATRQEADEFQAFAGRFLTAHLSGAYRAALFSMINEASFQPGVQRVAFDGRDRNCGQSRWKNGWTSYKSAADENAAHYQQRLAMTDISYRYPVRFGHSCMRRMPTMKWRALQMKMIFMAFGLLVSTATFGNGLAALDKTERCAAWVANAMHGATQAMRGASREVQYIPRSALGEMLAHSGSVARDKIYILADDGYTEEERDFLEKSTLFGYDAMSSWKSRNAHKGPSHGEWQRNLMAMCVEKDAV